MYDNPNLFSLETNMLENISIYRMFITVLHHSEAILFILKEPYCWR